MCRFPFRIQSRFVCATVCALFIAALDVTFIAGDAQAAILSTVAEQTSFRKTGRYDEVIQLCAAFQRHYPKWVRCQQFGRTPEGRPMLALIASRTGALHAKQAQARQLPITLIQGGIHAGEIDGKDAGFLTLREVLDKANSPLEKQVLIFVPVFNIDGHERFGAWNRPNQRGPEEMGWRTTAQNFNLNRDYVKADSPEMQAMLALINEWDPLASIDLHVTDGAKFEHDISIQVEPSHVDDAALQKVGASLRDQVIADLAQQGSLPLPFYMAFDVEDEPLSGFTDNVPSARFSNGYFRLRNRFGMLVETHSWKDYPTRVRITHNTIISVLNQIAAHGKDWRAIAQQADQRAAQLGGSEVPITYKTSSVGRPFDYHGYAFTRTPSEISGALMTRYDETTPQIWQVQVRDQISPDKFIRAPKAGYLVPSSYADLVAAKLKQHGIAYQQLNQTLSQWPVARFQTTQAQFNPQSYESHQTLTVQGEWQTAQRDVAVGALFVPIAQAKSRLVIELFEPEAKDALLFWGWFNNVFEKKEYMEAYVAEEVAREQLAADPALAAAFQQKLSTDPHFAKDPAARLEFFARRHASWDQRYQQYPVLKTDALPN